MVISLSEKKFELVKIKPLITPVIVFIISTTLLTIMFSRRKELNGISVFKNVLGSWVENGIPLPKEALINSHNKTLLKEQTNFFTSLDEQQLFKFYNQNLGNYGKKENQAWYWNVTKEKMLEIKIIVQPHNQQLLVQATLE